MRLIKAIAVIWCSGAVPTLCAQQIPQYTQYVFNYFGINPAVAGSKDCLDIRLGYRTQWVGFEGAPTTAWASVHGVLKPKGKSYQANRHGFGAFVEADDAGPLGYTHFYLAYAYHLKMMNDMYFAAGAFAGVKQFKLDAGQVTLAQYNDPAIEGKGSVMVLPEIVPGAWLYGKNMWLGLSIFGVLNNQVEGLGVESRLTRHYMLTGGYKFRVGKATSLSPSTLIKVSGGSPPALDINMMLEWKRTFGLGVTYRNTDAIAFQGRVGFLKYFALGYSYDITTSLIRVSSSNTHEVILSITPCLPDDPRKNIMRCPIFE